MEQRRSDQMSPTIDCIRKVVASNMLRKISKHLKLLTHKSFELQTGYVFIWNVYGSCHAKQKKKKQKKKQQKKQQQKTTTTTTKKKKKKKKKKQKKKKKKTAVKHAQMSGFTLFCTCAVSFGHVFPIETCPMWTYCGPLVADFVFCYERDFMTSLSHENQADIIEAFNSTSWYLDDLLNFDNIYFDQMVDRIYPTELQLNRRNSSDTEASFLDLNLFISNGTIPTKIYNIRDDFDFDIVNFPFLDGDVPQRTSYGVYISQLIRFARASSNLSDFNYRNKALNAKLLRQG